MMNRILLIAATTSTLLCSAANAADLGRKPTAPTFSAQPVASWTGFYVGINGGYGQDEGRVKGTTDKFKPKGGLIGVTVGYNYEFSNRIVAGLEADIAAASFSSKQVDSVLVGGTRFDDTVTAKHSMFATARARLGYSMGSWMPYVTAGLAFTNTSIKSVSTSTTGGITTFLSSASAKADSMGYALGAGVEAMLTSNISLKAEYIYAGFDSSKFNFVSNTGVQVGTAKASNSMHIGRVGLNYRF